MDRIYRARLAFERQMGDLIGDGDVSHLPGAGKPLKLDDDPHTPSDQRAARKIMQDHGVSPSWVAAAIALSQSETELQNAVAVRALRHRDELRRASSDAALNRATFRWSRFQTRFRTRVERHNREALLFNLKAPVGIRHKRILDAQALIEHALRCANPGH